MKLIAQVKLNPTKEQSAMLKKTLLAANAAAQYISDHAWMTKVFKQYDLHHALYYVVKEKFGLSAQMVVRTIAKVADGYKLDKETKRTFAPLGSIAYDERILTWKLDKGLVSIHPVNAPIVVISIKQTALRKISSPVSNAISR